MPRSGCGWCRTAPVVIFARDATPILPVLTSADDDTEDGRELLIVQAVSAEWRWTPRAE
jgi:hypothetical protein